MFFPHPPDLHRSSGDLCSMEGAFQRHYSHQIAKAKFGVATRVVVEWWLIRSGANIVLWQWCIYYIKYSILNISYIYNYTYMYMMGIIKSFSLLSNYEMIRDATHKTFTVWAMRRVQHPAQHPLLLLHWRIWAELFWRNWAMAKTQVDLLLYRRCREL